MKEYFNQFADEWVEKMSRAIAAKPLSEEEKGAADVFMDMLEEMGAEHYRDEAGNVIGILRGEGEGPTVMTNGHMDVVPAGNLDAWHAMGLEPFVPEVRDGKLYGRGTADMLQGTMSQLFAFREIKKMVDAGAKLNGNLVWTGVVNEEPAESMGAIWLCKETLPKYGIKPDFVILGEPTNGYVLTAQRGKVELVVDVYGKVAHSSAPWQGISAVEKAMPVMEAINNNMYKKGLTHEKLGFAAMCITDVEVSPGRMYSCVPDHCSITIDRRYVLPMTIQDTIDEIQEFLDFLASKDPDFKAEVKQRVNTRKGYTGFAMDVAKQHPAWLTDTESPFVKQTFESLKRIGQNPIEGCFVAGTDGSITMGVYGIPTVSYSMGHGVVCHQPCEYCVIEEEMQEIEGYTAIISDIFGLGYDEL
ncbi:MAG: M20/M25/M40 family metallo-hydrolase [Lachnospiraceae bacterium]|nr:M20/M25/M40 family metallo-hydrolase [Lachnospiraceae bacterium]